MNESVAQIAQSFLGTEYAANTLEVPGPERLVIRLDAVDCVTFYEYSLAFARCVHQGIDTFDGFRREVQTLRYRGGVIDGYPSRLHYTSDYFYDNEQRGTLADKTAELGGVPLKKTIDFMSTHADSYPHLKDDPVNLASIRAVERAIRARTILYIPKARVEKIAPKILDGDILGITTSVPGLDCSHTGIAFRKTGVLHMLHAPHPGLRVQVTEAPLGEYLARVGKDTGIIVARPLEPKG